MAVGWISSIERCRVQNHKANNYKCEHDIIGTRTHEASSKQRDSKRYRVDAAAAASGASNVVFGPVNLSLPLPRRMIWVRYRVTPAATRAP